MENSKVAAAGAAAWTCATGSAIAAGMSAAIAALLREREAMRVARAALGSFWTSSDARLRLCDEQTKGDEVCELHVWLVESLFPGS